MRRKTGDSNGEGESSMKGDEVDSGGGADMRVVS